jgi:hypothetical protein
MATLLVAPGIEAKGPPERRADIGIDQDPFTPPSPVLSVAMAADRARVAVSGAVVQACARPWGLGHALEITLDDGTSQIVLAFLGRRRIAGVDVGCQLVAAGTVGRHHGHRVVLNPCVWLVEH